MSDGQAATGICVVANPVMSTVVYARAFGMKCGVDLSDLLCMTRIRSRVDDMGLFFGVFMTEQESECGWAAAGHWWMQGVCLSCRKSLAGCGMALLNRDH